MLYIFIVFILLLFNLLFFFLFSKTSESGWLNAKLLYQQTLLEKQQQYYQELSGQHQKIRQLYYDMRNRFHILYHALEENDIVSAKQYLQKELKILEENISIYSGYPLLDSVCSHKKQQAIAQNTTCVIHSELEPNLAINETVLNDFIIILGSCFDNALEATKQIQDDSQRYIQVFLKNDETYLYLQIENVTENAVTLEGNQIPTTTKNNTNLHGLGLKNVKYLVELHEGFFYLNCKDCVFSVGLTIKYKSMFLADC